MTRKTEKKGSFEDRIEKLVKKVESEDLWFEFLGGPPDRSGQGSLCGLCGQSGIIDTMGQVYSPAGYHCGVIAFCICPNGREAKRIAEENKQTVLEWAAWARKTHARPARGRTT